MAAAVAAVDMNTLVAAAAATGTAVDVAIHYNQYYEDDPS